MIMKICIIIVVVVVVVVVAVAVVVEVVRASLGAAQVLPHTAPAPAPPTCRRTTVPHIILHYYII